MDESFSAALYRRLCAIGRFLAGGLYRPEVYGLENIPKDGPVILCANHLSLRDPILMASLVERPIAFMAKKELFKVKWFGSLLRRIGVFPVARGETDIGAVRTSISILKQEGCLGIFAQGTRKKKKQQADPPMNAGVALIAIRSGAPVIPVYVKGPYRIFRRVRFYFGKPLNFSDVKKPDSAALEGTTEQIRRAIYALDAPKEP